MKCVCPMGGDRTCPDDCPLAVWANMPEADRKKQRKPIAEKLYKDGFTMEHIATQLGVSKVTISTDLKDIVKSLNNADGRGNDTLGRKKSTGRPKNKLKPERRKNMLPDAETAAHSILDEGKTYAEVELETGLSSTVLRSAVAREEGARREPVIAPELLAMTAREKLEAAIRQHKRKLDIEFDLRIRAELKRYLDDVALPSYLKDITNLERSIRERKGVMDRITYRKILSCLHPDRVADPGLKKRYEEAFRLFTELEKRVLNEKESPTQFRRDVPRTYEELMKAKARVQAERRAKRAAKAGVSVR